MHTEGFTIFSLYRFEFCQVPSYILYMPSSPLGVYKPLVVYSSGQ